jgi:hypothetical protein
VRAVAAVRARLEHLQRGPRVELGRRAYAFMFVVVSASWLARL